MLSFKNSNDPPTYLSVLLNTEFQIIYCNNLLYETLHLESGSLVSKPLTLLKDLIDIEQCSNYADKCLKYPETIIKNENRIFLEKTFENKVFYWEINAITLSQKSVVGFSLVGADITKKISDEKERIAQAGILNVLKQSEEQFRSLSQNVPGAVYEYFFRKDGTNGFKYLSPSVRKMFGLGEELFMQSIDHVHPDDRNQLLKANKHSAETNEPFYFEGRLLTPDGSIRWHSASSSFSYVTKEGDHIFTGIILDITDRKETEEDTLRNESNLRRMLAKIGDNVWEYNFEKNVMFFSETVYNLLGHTANDLRSNIDLWWQSIYPADKCLIEENDKKYREGKLENHSLEYRVYHADGSLRWIMDRGVVIEKCESGKPIRIIGIHTDITREKEIHNKLLFQEQQKKKQILKAVIEAQERERQEIVHELNENINQVLSACKWMLAFVNNNEKQPLLEEVMGHIDKVITEIKNISYSLSSSTIELIGLPQAVNELISKINVNRKLEIRLDSKYFIVETEIDPKISLAIFRVIQEQIINIIKHAHATQVEIKLANIKNEISVIVYDNGIGFDAKTVKKGLGLVNIFSRVEYYNGKVQLLTKPGEGCSLKAVIPLL